uniref:WD repeat-containing protein 79 n=1 Tax=Meloidogyne enterolobii TaxID=390850 RepID=A0A6V7TLZ9_MELEN|nr:unnamed protein product [Meloidogyne enterolobii]
MDNSFSQRKRQMITKFGIGFLLQHMRGPTHETNSTDDESEGEPSSPKRDKIDHKLNIDLIKNEDILQENAENQVIIPKLTKISEDLSLPSDKSFYSNLKPFQEISDCFKEGTTPNFDTHIRRFTGENNYVRSCKWSSDGNWLISDSLDRFVRVFEFRDLHQKQRLLHASHKLAFGGLIYDLNWHPALNIFATTNKGSPIHCWCASVDGTKLFSSFRGINDKDELDSAYSLCFSIDGQHLFAGFKNCVRIFNFEKPGRQINEIKTYQKSTMKTQKGIISSIAMCPTFDGVFAVASYSGTLGLYSTQTNACDSLIGSNDGSTPITHLQYSSCGNLLFAGRRKSPFIQCYDVRLPTKLLYNFQRESITNQRIYFQLDFNDHYLYSGSSAGDLLIYDLKKCKKGLNQQELKTEFVEPAHKIKCSEAAVTGLSLHPCEQFIAVSTGQRLFPSSLLLNQLFDDNNSLNKTKNGDDDNNEYISRGNGSLLDNSIKLYKFD